MLAASLAWDHRPVACHSGAGTLQHPARVQAASLLSVVGRKIEVRNQGTDQILLLNCAFQRTTRAQTGTWILHTRPAAVGLQRLRLRHFECSCASECNCASECYFSMPGGRVHQPGTSVPVSTKNHYYNRPETQSETAPANTGSESSTRSIFNCAGTGTGTVFRVAVHTNRHGGTGSVTISISISVTIKSTKAKTSTH